MPSHLWVAFVLCVQRHRNQLAKSSMPLVPAEARPLPSGDFTVHGGARVSGGKGQHGVEGGAGVGRLRQGWVGRGWGRAGVGQG